MKKYINMLLVAAITIAFLPGCKKDDPKDYGASVRDKIWTGEFTYDGQPTGYYSVLFNADSTSIWSELGGTYSGGRWALSGQQLSIIQTPSVQAKGDISDDNILTNISNTSATMTVNSAQLNTHGYMILDNQLWKGTATDAGGVATDISISFSPASKMDFHFGTLSIYVALPYERVGASVRFTVSGITYFGVIMTNGTEIKGMTHGGASKYNWQVIKQ